ncbi:magnesium transporter [Paracoccus halophilus]|uniref:Magnesium transporter n=1 Tax=Paracoccus halophilus TaxID=376733 RepID=A0A099F1M4_9RHOB|nr:magnesium transporter CorA family protein [Paracoccus halophilus]KGJ04580.1 magnesium transporter [Paracoccus halophilus]SFA50128.1 magnesium transporter [Paracoccus halophilus]
MLYNYIYQNGGLAPLPEGADLANAAWIDLYRPLDSQVRAVATLGYEIPTLADMEEIEISNRLYTENGTSYMTGVLPGTLPDGAATAMPVTFILDGQRLITLRHHAPRPFDTFPQRADRTSSGCATPERIFLGLLEEIVGRLADISEGVARVLDETAPRVLTLNAAGDAGALQQALVTLGQQSELMSRVRMGLLSVERILAYHTATNTPHRADSTRPVQKAIQRDIQALEVHADFLGSRIAMTVDATMGMIGLLQNDRIRILSVVAALFVPPMLIASIYGMNFEHMPGLEMLWGFPVSMVVMLGSAVVTYLFLKWRNWL